MGASRALFFCRPQRAARRAPFALATTVAAGGNHHVVYRRQSADCTRTRTPAAGGGSGILTDGRGVVRQQKPFAWRRRTAGLLNPQTPDGFFSSVFFSGLGRRRFVQAMEAVGQLSRD